MSSTIEDYALIGDCETSALVARDGSMDWLCLPRFDSDACFAALVGTPDNGRWKLAPVAEAHIKRRYRPGTLILETEFRTDDGVVTLIDFMPLRLGNPQIFRIVRGDRGSVRMRMDLVIRFDYGRTVPWVTRRHDGGLLAVAGPHLLCLRTPVTLRGEGLRTIGEFTIEAGKTIRFGLQYGSSFEPVPDPVQWKSALKTTEREWCKWICRCDYRGPNSEMLERSLITLKALTYAPTGGILAAATTSLPEEPGGKRNWDYRYCWVRDATFTLLALLHAGYHDEARRWKDWLIRSVAGSADQFQVVYGVAGERRLREWELPWLAGYQGSRPVRVGNAASEQFQLDLFGELADVLHQAYTRGQRNEKSIHGLQLSLMDHLQHIWNKTDQGIWEMRGPKQHFTHSKVMAWVAFDRAIKTAEQFSLDAPLPAWRATRQKIHDDVCRLGFDSSLNSFVQFYGSKETDASLLLLPLVGFLPPSDPRIRGTIRRIEKTLLNDGLVIRYRTHEVDDGLPAGEGAFLPCSFWLADNYELVGRHADAKKLLKRLLELPNDVGLLSEEYHIEKKRLVGNFPQAFSHVAMVNTIINLHTRRGPAHQRSGLHSAMRSKAGRGKSRR